MRKVNEFWECDFCGAEVELLEMHRIFWKPTSTLSTNHEKSFQPVDICEACRMSKSLNDLLKLIDRRDSEYWKIGGDAKKILKDAFEEGFRTLKGGK